LQLLFLLDGVPIPPLSAPILCFAPRPFRHLTPLPNHAGGGGPRGLALLRPLFLLDGVPIPPPSAPILCFAPGPFRHLKQLPNHAGGGWAERPRPLVAAIPSRWRTHSSSAPSCASLLGLFDTLSDFQITRGGGPRGLALSRLLFLLNGVPIPPPSAPILCFTPGPFRHLA